MKDIARIAPLAYLTALCLGCAPHSCALRSPPAPKIAPAPADPGASRAPWRGPDRPAPAERGNRSDRGLRAVKRSLYTIHEREGHQITFYCGCRYRDRVPVWGSCGYAPKKRSGRAARTEVEHLVPAARFGRGFKAWAKGDPACARSKSKKRYRGRACARRADARFRRVEADLHNLRPVIGELNAERGAYPAGVVPGEPRAFGACDVELGRGRFEPPDRARGDLARTYFYMAWAYPDLVRLSDQERETFARWANEDPPDDWERRWAALVEREQGHANPFVPPPERGAARTR